ncbi:hypothetical protein CY34DRAFT_804815 [Suillus luteus UH-Slu-Lm8-n1]|uniref:Uncharacterized protein n=1 Tax=Suillus luteus UH-Slu-Lm8-n1 TaxID=930992 RepID=A0A0D0B866_9AGAM|nr:hypothetical protein CY34DRAFT_804815 [Suillus luteus UH-Slu-Lm8-n1]
MDLTVCQLQCGTPGVLLPPLRGPRTSGQCTATPHHSIRLVTPELTLMVWRLLQRLITVIQCMFPLLLRTGPLLPPLPGHHILPYSFSRYNFHKCHL